MIVFAMRQVKEENSEFRIQDSEFRMGEDEVDKEDREDKEGIKDWSFLLRVKFYRLPIADSQFTIHDRGPPTSE